MDDGFNHILATRKTPHASPDLARRIIQNAQHAQEKRKQGMGWFAIIKEVLKEVFYIPRPEFAFAVVLVLGLLIGAYMGQTAMLDQPYGFEITDAFVLNDNFTVGDFL